MLKNEIVSFPSRAGVLKKVQMSHDILKNYANLKTPQLQHKPSLVKKDPFHYELFSAISVASRPIGA